jgi:multiple sugar transport system substrate-binding protein
MILKRKGITRTSAAIVLSASLALAGCSGGKTPDQASNSPDQASISPAKAKDTTPVTLSLYQIGAGLSDEQFDLFFVKTLKAKMPHITLNLVRVGTGTNPQDLITAGTFPDIIFTANPRFREFQNLQVVQGLDSMIKNNNTNLKIFDPLAIETIRNYSSSGELIALPFAQNLAALFYNKDIFDKFGVPYPKDGMDWQETMELARKVSRIEGGTQYRGLEVIDARQLGSPLSLPWVNPTTLTSAVNSEGWKRVFQLVRDMNSIPNNEMSADNYGQIYDNFIKHRNVAMLPVWVNGVSTFLEEAHAKGGGFNWDIVTLPNFKEAVGTGRGFDFHSLMISNKSKHKEQAFNVIELLTSEAVQFIVTGTGRLAAVNTPELQKNYAADLASFKGKNIASIFKNRPAKLNPPTDFDAIVSANLDAATKRVVTTKDDINTVLRELEEQTNKQIAEEKTKLK